MRLAWSLYLRVCKTVAGKKCDQARQERSHSPCSHRRLIEFGQSRLTERKKSTGNVRGKESTELTIDASGHWARAGQRKISGPSFPQGEYRVRRVFVNLRICCAVGHFTSSRSTTFAFPSRKRKRRSLCDMTLPPLATSFNCDSSPVATRTRAPTAVRLHFVRNNFILIQLFLLPPSLRSSEGKSFMSEDQHIHIAVIVEIPKGCPAVE